MSTDRLLMRDSSRYVGPRAGNVTVNSAAAYLASVRAGFGIVQIPEFGVRAGLESGELLESCRSFARRRYRWRSCI